MQLRLHIRAKARGLRRPNRPENCVFSVVSLSTRLAMASRHFIARSGLHPRDIP